MEDKNELTENLKVIENEIHDGKADLRAINHKLQTAYQYEEDLVSRATYAKNKTLALQKEFFEKSSEINEKYRKMQKVFDIFTGNFYKD